MSEPRLAICPGSFDPLTNGHVDIIETTTRLFDRVVVAVLANPEKHAFMSADDRAATARETFHGRANIEVVKFQGLLVDLVRELHAAAIVRGLRSVTDFDYESTMAQTNRHMLEGATTIFLLPSHEHNFVSSTLVRQIAKLGGSVHGMVPPAVETRLRAMFSRAGTHRA